MASVIDISKVSSTTYLDVAGVSMGVQRLMGEPTPKYLARLQEAAAFKRGHPYKGLYSDLSIRLGLNLGSRIRVECNDNAAILVCGPDVVTIAGPELSASARLVNLDRDGLWNWRMLSDVIADLNTTIGINARLLSEDAPALQLARQSNIQTQISEDVTAKTSQLANVNLIPGSEVFSNVVPTYSLTADGHLSFTAIPPDPLSISYRYLLWPFEIVGSDVALISLSEAKQPMFQAPDGTTSYEAREFIQAVMQQDRSYWAR